VKVERMFGMGGNWRRRERRRTWILIEGNFFQLIDGRRVGLLFFGFPLFNGNLCRSCRRKRNGRGSGPKGWTGLPEFVPVGLQKQPSVCARHEGSIGRHPAKINRKTKLDQLHNRMDF
jgi:hypothetical protein